ncbi:hypothetical protein [Lentilactobacillus kosonis]|uniref:D-alanyl-D-alanine carboxypeptidase n=1 Tax=Lentilactobacillus kosonis TaxID=2810561 RepID=A0A401FM57_9LACO|nr:hypothetical protein [Lentilactobacillus kosonis]GAY73464.1 D-alanyl-D-alanine carboxypeptidase [Lentilactobacillus kosonis]
MNKKITSILATGLLATGLGLVAQQSAAHASNYAWISSKTYVSTSAYKVKVTGKSAYMWNWNHTKKLHNLRNYPRTTWYVQRSVKLRHNGRNLIYWQVKNTSGRVIGYVWRQYFAPGGVKGSNIQASNNNSQNSNTFSMSDIPIFDNYKSDQDYLNFIKYSPNQNGARLILKALPNASLSLNLSRYATSEGNLSDDAEVSYGTVANKIVNKEGLVKNAYELKNLEHLFWNSNNVSQSEINEALTKDGFSSDVRIAFHGQIGLIILDNVQKSKDGSVYSGDSIYALK